MARNVKYDIDAEWDDPYERARERRKTPRCTTSFMMKIAVRTSESASPLVGPARIQDVSTTGVRCLTKHKLAPGENVQVAVPTGEFPDLRGLPKAFVGTARVVRSQRVDDAHSMLSMKFGPEIAEDMDFSVFWDHLNTLSPMGMA
jgi:hypothetical protein